MSRRDYLAPAMLVTLCCVAATGLWVYRLAPLAPVGAVSPPPAPHLCQATPALIARQQTLALRPAFRFLVAHLSDAPYYRLTFAPALAAHSLTVREDLCYTNLTNDRLTTLALRLYVNYPVDNGFRPAHLTVDGRPSTVTIDPRDPTFALLSLPAPLSRGQHIDIHLDLMGRLPVAAADAPVVPAMQFLDGGAFGQFPHYLTLAWAYAQVGVHKNHRWSHTILTPFVDILSAPVSFFDATVTLPRAYGLVSSGVTVSVAQSGRAQSVYRVVTGPVRDLTLEAGPHLTRVTLADGDVRIESAYEPSPSGFAAVVARHYAALARTALTLADRIFAPYPYAKITLTEAPIGASGLQWSTFIQMQNNQYEPHSWGPPGLAGVDLSSNEGVLLAHEVSHQWWYGLVGNDQVNNGFLSEGLATFSQLFLPIEEARQVAPHLVAAAWRRASQNWHASVLDAYWMSGGRDVVIDQAAVDAPGGDPHYANYEKSSLFFALYGDRFGRTALLTFLHRYATRNMFRIATLDDLERALVDAAPGHEASVRQMVTDWFRHPNLARVIDPRAVAPTPPWLPGILTQIHDTFPQLRSIALSPEDEVRLGLGIEPFDAAARPYATSLGPNAALTRIFATLHVHGWVVMAPVSGGPGIARIECRRGGQLMAIVAAAPDAVTPAARPALAKRVPRGQIVVVIEVEQA